MICKPGGKPAGLFLRLNQSCFFIMRLKLFRPFPPGKKKGADFSAPVFSIFLIMPGRQDLRKPEE